MKQNPELQLAFHRNLFLLLEPGYHYKHPETDHCHVLSQNIETNTNERKKVNVTPVNQLTVAPSKVPCSDPDCLAFGRTMFFCLAFLRS